MMTVSNPFEPAIIPSMVDFPTPEPAKMPMRWPAQIGTNKSMTRTPVFNGDVTRARRRAEGGGGVSMGTGVSPRLKAPRPSTGRPKASITRPFQLAAGERWKGPMR
jgi:hypothetical protein